MHNELALHYPPTHNKQHENIKGLIKIKTDKDYWNNVSQLSTEDLTGEFIAALTNQNMLEIFQNLLTTLIGDFWAPRLGSPVSVRPR